jgi:biopolymer transport protein TolR
VPVDLPRTEAQSISDPEEPLIVTVNRDGAVFVQESEASLGNLVPLLIAITDANPEAQIYIRGDRELVYGRIMEVMGAISSAGFTRVSLIAELPEGQQ